jgi:hypothetical protein
MKACVAEATCQGCRGKFFCGAVHVDGQHTKRGAWCDKCLPLLIRLRDAFLVQGYGHREAEHEAMMSVKRMAIARRSVGTMPASS